MVLESLQPLKSTFADDPAIADIIPLFLANLSGYVEGLDKALRGGDLQAALRICHDLKGTAGGYGYPALSEVAADLERHLKSGQQTVQSGSLMETVRHLSMRAQKALPSSLEEAGIQR